MAAGDNRARGRSDSGRSSAAIASGTVLFDVRNGETVMRRAFAGAERARSCCTTWRSSPSRPNSLFNQSISKCTVGRHIYNECWRIAGRSFGGSRKGRTERPSLGSLKSADPDVLQRALGLGVQALRQLVKDIRRLAYHAACGLSATRNSR